MKSFSNLSFSHTQKLIMGEMTLYSFERCPDKVLQHLLN